jgi:hypothetical protein
LPTLPVQMLLSNSALIAALAAVASSNSSLMLTI